ncbi:Integral membrane protein [Pleurostoma richardsiae]|uniref:Integral membrane protein n=1 Tax=Pleurostoma richardsiae TaxID=41990 RepID=A0AA38RKJ2_9PEZI|nr:Integral membrane protein [Pleurostoma richardsiae]
MVAYVVFPTLGVVKAHLIVNCVLCFIAYTVVGLRIASRIISGAKIGWDDIFVLLAVPQALGMLIIQGMYSQLGVGYHVTEAGVNLPMILRLLVCYELIFATSTFTVKLSVLFFYLRVFVNRGLRLATQLTLGFVCAWTLGNIMQVFLICRPFRAAYDTTVKGKCGNQVASFIAIGVFNIVTDIIILTLPVPTIWTLKTGKKVKAALTGVMMIGLLVSVVAVARIVALTSLDLTFDLTGTMIYADWLSAVEPNLAILCISLPMLRPLRTHIRSRKTPSHALSNTDENSRFNDSKRMRIRDANDDSFAMETIYAPNAEVHYEATAGRSRSRSRDESGSLDGSETELSPKGLQSNKAITVETRWVVTESK